MRFLRLRLKKNRVPTCVYESAIKIQDDMRDLELLWRRKRRGGHNSCYCMGIIIGLHHHGRHSQQASLLPSAPFCCCFVVVVLPPPPTLGEYAPQMLPGSSAIRWSHRLATHILPAPQNASLCFFATGMGFCFPFQPTFSSCFCCCCFTWALSQSFEIPCHFLAVGPWCALTKPWSIKASIVFPFHALNLCKDWWILMKI